MKYLNMSNDDLRNGEGVRVVLWVSGCNHFCKGCHNPESWNCNNGYTFNEEAKEELFKELNKTYITGLTLSGGDPLFPSNRDELTKLCKEVKEKFPNKDIWCWTGYLYEEVKSLPIMQYIDVLIDGPYIEELRDITLQWRGSSNQKIIKLNNRRK